ncbi:hypothetical protein GCM10010510_19240 [Streptomyces anandii JCM 4720]|nr:hypothetical protein GCM10010510_19240 [Streptomyces anandii JCM 4720]
MADAKAGGAGDGDMSTGAVSARTSPAPQAPGAPDAQGPGGAAAEPRVGREAVPGVTEACAVDPDVGRTAAPAAGAPADGDSHAAGACGDATAGCVDTAPAARPVRSRAPPAVADAG